jgi:hypothetical protein
MTRNAIDAKSEALEPHELSPEELDAVSGGAPTIEQQQQQVEAKKQSDAIKAFQQLLQEI